MVAQRKAILRPSNNVSKIVITQHGLDSKRLRQSVVGGERLRFHEFEPGQLECFNEDIVVFQDSFPTQKTRFSGRMN